MKRLQLFSLLLGLPFGNTFAQDVMVYRSEFESVNEVLIDIDHANEGSESYSIISGNSDNYYKIDGGDGELKINAEIPDVMGTLTEHDLVVGIGSEIIEVKVVDAYDYFLSTHSEYIVLDEHQDTHVDLNSNYTPYNNLWGDGTAIPNQDYRMATLVHPDSPDSTVFIWDVPSKAADFGGSSVWSYVNVIWGNRPVQREDLSGFPFQVKDIERLAIDFDFEKLFGTDDYKIALNHFFTDESGLEPFSSNDGDFFMVFDQVGTWVPPYPVDLGDTVLNGENFSRLYKKEGDYEWRRVIVRDNGTWLKGQLDLLDIYESFIAGGYINEEQYIPNIQIGIEITDGFGAVRFNKWAMDLQKKSDVVLTVAQESSAQTDFYPNPTAGYVYFKEVVEFSVYNSLGAFIAQGKGDKVDLSVHPDGLYIIKTKEGAHQIIKD